jgi:phosphate transport system permease protein
VVLPKALPGILTGVILTLSRAAGETAPILFTGVAFYINSPASSINQEFMALPYHLYMLSTQHQSIEQVRPLASGTAVVLIILVFMLNLIAFYIRFKNRTQD